MNKSRFTRPLVAFIAVLGVSATAIAQPTTPTPAQIQQVRTMLAERFAKADVNKDGKLTKEEAKGVMPRVYEYFDKIDTAKRGYLTRQQIEDFGMKMLAEQQ